MEGSRNSRRQFIRNAGALVAFGSVASFPNNVLAGKKQTKITILHTNDWHSRIEPFPAGSGNMTGRGGVAIRSALINKIREEEEHVLLLDAGDVFQGTPYFNFFNGELEYKLMSKMGYDAMTLGNHDFDNGIKGILSQLNHANFDILNCNYDFGTTELSKHVQRYKIINKGGIRIGLLGVGIDLKGYVADDNYKGIQYRDPIQPANEIAAELKQKHQCHLVICLSHIGYEYDNDKVSDIRLAEASEHIDVIIGGHTHTFLDKPRLVQNKAGKTVIINQVGWAGVLLGRMDFTFSATAKSDRFSMTHGVIDITPESLVG